MKYYVLIFSLAICLLGCSKSTRLKEVKMEIYPAFAPITTFSIDMKNRILKVECDESHTLEEKSDSLSYVVYERDTFIVRYNRSFEIGEQAWEEWKATIKEVDLEETQAHGESGYLDGVSYKYTEITNVGDTTILFCRMPLRKKPEYERDFKLLDGFFGMTDRTMTDWEGKLLLKELHPYFSYRKQ